MTEETEGQRGWMLVKLADETKARDVAKAIWQANEGDWLKAKGSDVEVGCVSRADVVHLDAAMATALGCKEAIVVPLALKDGTTPEAASEAIKGYAGQGAEVYWLQAVAHNPAVIVEEAGAETPAMPLPTPSTHDKKPPGSVLEGRNAWG